jgi:phosphoglycerate dehydrogenase-like enzyme
VIRELKNMKIWKNTSTLDGYDEGLPFTSIKEEADIVLLGSKPIGLEGFSNLKGIFRVGISRDNVPIEEAETMGIIVRFPSQETIDIVYEETACFTCSLIFRMLYSEIGTLDPWWKGIRVQLNDKVLLVIGMGNIGGRVAKKMKGFLKVDTFDVLQNTTAELKALIESADCITLHIPKNEENNNFIDGEKLSWMKDGSVLINTARGAAVNEDALFKEIESFRLLAAFDVYWQEPYQGKLKKYHPDHFYMTPHVASTCNGFLEGCRKDLDILIEDLFRA